MAINGVNSVGATSLTTALQPTGRNSIQAEDFYKLLVTQLQNQDPLKPADNQAILQQFSMIRQLENSESLNSTLGRLTSQDRLGTYAALIGKLVAGKVTGADGTSTTVAGKVLAVSIQANGKAVLELDSGHRLPADEVDSVSSPEFVDLAGASQPTARTRSTAIEAGLGPFSALLGIA